ncbi:MAG: C1 family peptidase [Halopseudomonas sp.]
MSEFPVTKFDGFELNVAADMPDDRDWYYTAPPIQLDPSLPVPSNLNILDQKSEGACTGFGLAAVINLLNQNRRREVTVSARMLYEMARKFDEWPGEAYSGSSCRGAIKGFSNMGVCQDSEWPYEERKPGELTVSAAQSARSNTIGAYYRLSRRISDYHAALNEAGAIFCSATVHSGWSRSECRNGVIPYRSGNTGGHAFAIVGYNEDGFFVQNSWDTVWGKNGVALWSYEDWQENLKDGWVLNLALPTPQIWYKGEAQSGRATGGGSNIGNKPSRGQIAGHFAHIDDGKFHDSGRYWSNLSDVKTTAKKLLKSTKYDHLLLYAHGGLNSPADSAERIASMRDVFKENGIYPFHFMYDTGILEELKDIIISRGKRAGERTAGLVDMWDKILERLARPLGRALWREMKYGAEKGFDPNRAGTETLLAFNDVMTREETPLQVHLVGHSTGAILIANLLKELANQSPNLRIKTCSLMAPAATVDLFDKHYKPYLVSSGSSFGINKMAIYNLTDELERDDSVGPYRKSLLYFVSRSFEEDTPAPILGMQNYSKDVAKQSPSSLEVLYSHGDGGTEASTTSQTHGGFDNDPATLNDILKRVLGKEPRRPFRDSDLDY